MNGKKVSGTLTETKEKFVTPLATPTGAGAPKIDLQSDAAIDLLALELETYLKMREHFAPRQQAQTPTTVPIRERTKEKIVRALRKTR